MQGLLKFNHFMVLILIVVLFTLSNVIAATPSNSVHSFANPELKIEYLDEHQQSSSVVTTLTQDRHGFLWLGSTSGLRRFDGNNFKNFTFDYNNSNSLPDNFIRALLVDSRQRLWVGTEGGLALYNGKLENFDRYTEHGLVDNKIWAIFEDREQQLWVSTHQGVHIFNDETQRFELLKLTLDGQRVSPGMIKNIYQDPAGFIWLGAYDGDSYLLEPDNHTLFLPTKINSASIVLPKQGIHQIIELSNHQQLVITPQEIFRIGESGSELLLRAEVVGSQKFNRAELDVDGNLWVASTTGINLYQLSVNKLVFIQALISGQEIYSLFRDKNDTMWFGSHTSGLGRYRRQSDYFKHLSTKQQVLADNVVWSIKEDPNQGIWAAGSDSKLTRLAFDSQQSVYFDTGIDGPKSIVFDAAGLLYVAADSGLFRFNPGADNFIASKVRISDKETAYLTIAGDYLYLGAWEDGLYRISLIVGDDFVVEPVLFAKQAIPYVTTLNSDSSQLYIGTLSGLLRLNLANGQITEVAGLAEQRVSYIHIAEHDIYVSTASQGVYHFDAKLERLRGHINNDSLLNRAIYAVLVDAEHKLWLSTDNGVISVGPDGDVRLFGAADGLQGLDFNDNSALLSDDGTLLFGGVYGLNYIRNNQLTAPEVRAVDLKFTEFNLFNEPVVIGGDVNGFERISRSIVYSPQVRLNYGDYPFEFSFNLVNYPLSNQIHYRYRIPGIDKDWIRTKSLASATYTNLSFGHYRLEVEALLSGSPEPIATTSIALEILPPVWLSSWSLFGYFVILSFIFYTVARVIRQRRADAAALKESAERLKLSLWGSGDEMWDWHLTSNKIYRTEQWQQLDFDGFSDRSLSKIHPNDRQRTKQLLQSHLDGSLEYFEANYRIRRKDNDSQWIWILDRAKVVEHNSDGSPSRMTGTIRDITEIKDAELKLTLQAEAIENISDAIYILDLDYNIVEANKAFETITGYRRIQVIGNSKIFDSYQPKMSGLIRARLNQGQGWSGELKAQRSNGEYYYIQLNINTILDDDNEVSHYVAAFSDITSRKATETELRNLSNVDTLTQLPNRSYFQHAHRNLIRRDQPHALLTLDLDNFKKVNDSMGHDQGDKLLCLISQRLDQQIRCQHLLCRLGSDEFAILLEDIDQISMITQVISEIEVALQEPFMINEAVLVMSCSIGVAIFPNDGQSTENMLQSADTAMYHAKSDAGISYQFYSASMNESAVRRLQIESMIRQALKNDWFEVYYQPKYDATTGDISGMEALVRLIHPELGMISPNEFIPVAEDTGLVIEIGETVLRKACFATQQWRRRGLFSGRVAVNLAAKQFAQADLVRRITQILECTQLPVTNLELEITEGTVIEDPELAITTMLSLTNIGISLALDDFGTGYSSLSYLKRFPIHTLKIDKAFIDDLTIEQGERHMVASIISIAHNMGLSVVAEGVETQEQLTILKQLSCETIQGFLFSRPLSENDFLALLLQQEQQNRNSA